MQAVQGLTAAVKKLMKSDSTLVPHMAGQREGRGAFVRYILMLTERKRKERSTAGERHTLVDRRKILESMTAAPCCAVPCYDWDMTRSE